MKLRPPSTPLITVDPYFSVWSQGEELNHSYTLHWTGVPHSITGSVVIDGVPYGFLGYDRNVKKIKQTSKDFDALSTYYTFENEKVKLIVRFTSPLLIDDLYLLSRPISYLSVKCKKKDASIKRISIIIGVEKWICLDRHHQSPVTFTELSIDGMSGFKMGNCEQRVLNKSGDDVRIDWGYFYLCVKGEGHSDEYLLHSGGERPSLSVDISNEEEKVFLFAYDDIYSINYFGSSLKAYWKSKGNTMEDTLIEGANDYNSVIERCDLFASNLIADANKMGGSKYSEILSLAYRQVINAHKLVLDDDGNILFISKECFSNGCASTVDITYPSSPLFIKYNTELLKGMLRPIYKYVNGGNWCFDFAPHDVGQYPLLLGQVYGNDCGKLKREDQMPVEECGNMIITEANIALREGNADFAREHIDILRQWVKYLIVYGDDPENQLCTDDFAGHLAHNCNLSLKGIMGIMGMSIITDFLGYKDESDYYARLAREKSLSWCERAKNSDGSYRLAFDKENTSSMKYNMVWDKLWGTKLFSKEVYKSEISSYLHKMNKYGLPLDSRCDQTKSDWLVWVATMCERPKHFKEMIFPLWLFYNNTPDRVPMTDWYDTISGRQIGFQHRAVQGGLFIKLLDDGTLNYRKE